MVVFCEGSASKLKQFTKSLCSLASYTKIITDGRKGSPGQAPKIIFEREGKGRKGVVDETGLALN